MYARRVLQKKAYQQAFNTSIKPIRKYGRPYSFNFLGGTAPGARQQPGLLQLLGGSILNGNLNKQYGEEIGKFLTAFGGQQPNAVE